MGRVGVPSLTEITQKVGHNGIGLTLGLTKKSGPKQHWDYLGINPKKWATTALGLPWD